MKVTIVGKSFGWTLAPQTAENVWGVNDLFLCRDVDMIFNMHDLQWCKKHEPKETSATIEYANKHSIPLIALDKWDEVPTSAAFPIKEMHCQFFTNSIAYMVAYAEYKGATEIDIYGVEMAFASEYFKEKHSIDYWIGYARGKGVKVNTFGRTYLCKSITGGLYGYDIQEINGKEEGGKTQTATLGEGKNTNVYSLP